MKTMLLLRDTEHDDGMIEVKSGCSRSGHTRVPDSNQHLLVPETRVLLIGRATIMSCRNAQNRAFLAPPPPHRPRASFDTRLATVQVFHVSSRSAWQEATKFLPNSPSFRLSQSLSLVVLTLTFNSRDCAVPTTVSRAINFDKLVVFVPHSFAGERQAHLEERHGQDIGSMPALIWSRDIGDDVANARNTFSSWDACMSEAYCKVGD